VNALQPLWQLSEDLEALLDSLDTCPEELLPELEQRIATYVAAEVQKVDNVAAALAMLENTQASAKAEIDRLQQRKQSAQRAAERLEAYILRVLRERDGKTLKGRNVTFSMRRSDALVIDDPDAVPEKWKRTTIVMDILKDPIKRTVKAGETVPGVHIEHRENLVRK
jgi:hypothetical protein